MATSLLDADADPIFYEDVDIAKMSAYEKNALLLELEKRLREQSRNGILFYKPHAKQIMFHMAGDIPFRYAQVGNRFGKSEMGAAEDISFCLGERLFFPAGHPGRTKGIPARTVKGVLLCQDWDKSEEIFTNRSGDDKTRGKLFRLLPADRIEAVKTNHSGKVCRIDIKGLYGTSSIYIDTVASYKQDPMSHESSDWDFIHVDEPIPKKMWEAHARGLVDREGSAWFTCTPLSEPWINDFFLPSVRYKFDESRPYKSGDYWVMRGSMTDNPFLSPKAIERYINMLDAETKECRLHGIPSSMAGIVYKEFQPHLHVLQDVPIGWNNFHDPPPDYTIRYAIDPHPRQPHAVLFAATAPTGQVFFFYEIFEKCLIGDLAEQIKSIVQGRFVQTALCDPLAYIENPLDGSTWANELYRHDLFVEKASKDLKRGIQRVKQELAMANNLFFAPGLAETIKEFDYYRWNDKKPDSPVDKDDHMMENLYRLVINGLHYVAPPYFDKPAHIKYGGVSTPKFQIKKSLARPLTFRHGR